MGAEKVICNAMRLARKTEANDDGDDNNDEVNDDDGDVGSAVVVDNFNGDESNRKFLVTIF